MTPLLSSGRRQSNRANIRWHHSTQEVLPRRPHPHDRGHGRGEGHRHSRRERILSHGKSFVKISSATETVQHQIKHFMSKTGYKFHEPLLFNVVVWGWLFQEQYCSVYKYNMSVWSLFPYHYFKSFIVFYIGPGRVSSTGLDPIGTADPDQEGLHASLHSLLHEEGHHARSCSALPVRRRTVQGKMILLFFLLSTWKRFHSIINLCYFILLLFSVGK